MFTGLVEHVGVVTALDPIESGFRLVVDAGIASELAPGDSVAVNGVCLTAVDVRADSFSADLAPETLRRSNLGALGARSRVNL